VFGGAMLKNIILLIEIIEKWTSPKGNKKTITFFFIILLQIGVYKLVYFTGGAQYSYSQIMYLTLILGSLFFGIFGGFIFGVSGGIILGPYMPLNTLSHEIQSTINWSYRLGFYILVGLMTGVIMEFLVNTIKKLNKLTFYNHSTGLPNGKYFQTMNIKEDSSGYLFVIELNNYSQILYNLGYEFSMKLVSAFSRQILNVVKNYEDFQMFHFQDNKFGVLVKNKNEKEIFKKIMDLEHHPIKVNGIEVHPYIFIGAARCEKNSSELLKKAEHARLFAKRNLRNYCMYAPDLTSKIDKNFKLFEEFPRAMHNREFYLCYHPKCELSTGNITGAEVLIRWKHPTRGIVGPNDFIPYLETTTFITDITKWILSQSLRTSKIMSKSGIEIRLAVNIPLKMIEDPKFIDYLKELEKSGYPLNRIELEILERDYVEDFEKLAKIMKSIKKMGITLALDDFGTGYSAFSYVKKLPFDKIKVDKMFIKNLRTDIENQGIVLSSINMAHAMGIEVVAEGVESQEDLDILKKLKCDYAQGFYFTPPLKGAEFMEWVHGIKN
jgi:EAL domain-containing protein (putative c-di-GMP-specific phosphodiesterase class I)/GGDEF domain-containing protein